MTDPVEYWQQAAARASANYEAIIESQRECIAELQRRCQELLYERTMMRAANAMDFRDFCLSAAAATTTSNNNNGGNGNGAVVPLDALLSYLHNATDGLVPAPDSRRKRVRPNTSESAALFVASPSVGPVHATTSSSPSPHLVPEVASSALSLSDDALQQQQQKAPLNVNVAFRTGPPLSPRTRALQRALFLRRRRLREGDLVAEDVDVAGEKSSSTSVTPAAGQSFRSAASSTTQRHSKQDRKKLVS